MKSVKKILVLSGLLTMYIFVVALLMRSLYIYQTAYQNLSRLISHPSIELQDNNSEQGEE